MHLHTVQIPSFFDLLEGMKRGLLLLPKSFLLLPMHLKQQVLNLKCAKTTDKRRVLRPMLSKIRLAEVINTTSQNSALCKFFFFNVFKVVFYAQSCIYLIQITVKKMYTVKYKF